MIGYMQDICLCIIFVFVYKIIVRLDCYVGGWYGNIFIFGNIYVGRIIYFIVGFGSNRIMRYVLFFMIEYSVDI